MPDSEAGSALDLNSILGHFNDWTYKKYREEDAEDTFIAVERFLAFRTLD
jgi:hypothetical protein